MLHYHPMSQFLLQCINHHVNYNIVNIINLITLSDHCNNALPYCSQKLYNSSNTNGHTCMLRTHI